jgi:hypothetical protein
MLTQLSLTIRGVTWKFHHSFYSLDEAMLQLLPILFASQLVFSFALDGQRESVLLSVDTFRLGSQGVRVLTMKREGKEDYVILAADDNLEEEADDKIILSILKQRKELRSKEVGEFASLMSKAEGLPSHIIKDLHSDMSKFLSELFLLNQLISKYELSLNKKDEL